MGKQSIKSAQRCTESLKQDNPKRNMQTHGKNQTDKS